MAKRRIVQIAVAPGSEANTSPHLVALCDDGSLWKAWRSAREGPDWVLLPPIPQDDEP